MNVQTDVGARSVSSGAADASKSRIVEHFDRWSGSYFVALFAGALFDQVVLPEVAAGLDSTGRVRFTPFARAGRTAASDQLVGWGDAATKRAEMDRLKTLHRDVHGTSPEGVRYSALAPQAWNWILMSTMFMYLNSFKAVSAEPLGPEDLQTLWEHQIRTFEGLQLDGRQGLPDRYDEAVAAYAEVIGTKAEPTAIFTHVTGHLRRPPAPEAMPAIARPAWNVVAPVLIHPVAILSIGITHPDVRALGRHRWGRRQSAEFALYTALVRTACKRLPSRLTLTPLAYNRYQYERLVNRYEGAALRSFAPSNGCPIGR